MQAGYYGINLHVETNFDAQTTKKATPECSLIFINVRCTMRGIENVRLFKNDLLLI